MSRVVRDSQIRDNAINGKSVVKVRVFMRVFMRVKTVTVFSESACELRPPRSHITRVVRDAEICCIAINGTSLYRVIFNRIFMSRCAGVVTDSPGSL